MTGAYSTSSSSGSEPSCGKPRPLPAERRQCSSNPTRPAMRQQLVSGYGSKRACALTRSTQHPHADYETKLRVFSRTTDRATEEPARTTDCLG